jgi:hypothetical protein
MCGHVLMIRAARYVDTFFMFGVNWCVDTCPDVPCSLICGHGLYVWCQLMCGHVLMIRAAWYVDTFFMFGVNWCVGTYPDVPCRLICGHCLCGWCQLMCGHLSWCSVPLDMWTLSLGLVSMCGHLSWYSVPLDVWTHVFMFGVNWCVDTCLYVWCPLMCRHMSWCSVSYDVCKHILRFGVSWSVDAHSRLFALRRVVLFGRSPKATFILLSRQHRSTANSLKLE